MNHEIAAIILCAVLWACSVIAAYLIGKYKYRSAYYDGFADAADLYEADQNARNCRHPRGEDGRFVKRKGAK